MRFKKAKEDETILGITPLIDIVFLLLIFFMMTSHFGVVSGIQINLPKTGQQVTHRESERIILLIDKEGRIYLKGEVIDIKNLGLRLENLVKNNGLTSLVLEADKEVKHGRVVHVMDFAKRAGVLSILIAARCETEKGF
ncbi:MAG TPA: biopolymer transporter ExbD [Desulfobacteraceae bacterium]|jgi:biopolymer transport protein ExbD|nr:biopolymer transporter ExbD [Desulfobacteraceae bacterium]HPJ67845.1 biopolymer transporter ExbD [Desulfobacteraceae bacterium]HPQ28153.1 biopolymer transporter ExbD [Desulfobacteraceae bacterium]